MWPMSPPGGGLGRGNPPEPAGPGALGGDVQADRGGYPGRMVPWRAASRSWVRPGSTQLAPLKEAIISNPAPVG